MSNYITDKLFKKIFTGGGTQGPPGPQGPPGENGVSLSTIKADTDIASAISLKHALNADNQDLTWLQPKETGKGLSTNDLTDILKGFYDDAVSHSESAHAPAGAEANVNADWNASSGDAQIMNKPTIPAAQVQTDWNASAGMGVLLNKPTISGSNTGDETKGTIESKLTGVISSHSHSGGADPFTAKLILLADKPTGANVTPVTLGLSFNYEANSKYVIDIYAIVAPAVASTGCGFMIDVSTAVTFVGTFVAHQLAITGTLSGAGSVGDLAVASSGVSSGMVLAGSNFVYGGGILVTGANTGTATFFFRSETTAITTCKTGTMFRVMKMN